MPLWIFETTTLFTMRLDARNVLNEKSIDAHQPAQEMIDAINAELKARGETS